MRDLYIKPNADTTLQINGVTEGTHVAGSTIDIQLTDGVNPVNPDSVTVVGDVVTVQVPVKKWWERPKGWVDMPVITAGDNTFAAVAAVYEDDNLNWFRISGATSINWGDGTLNDVNHQLIYANTTSPILVDNNGKNYKTVLVTGGCSSSLSFIDLPNNNVRAQNWLDLLIDSPTQSQITISSFNQCISPICERVEFISPMPNLVWSNSRMSYMTNLKVLKGLDFSSIITSGVMFQFSGDFRQDEYGTPLNYNPVLATNIEQDFQCCGITKIGDVNVTSATNIALMFQNSKINSDVKIISSNSLANITSLLANTTATGLEISDCSGVTTTTNFAPLRTLQKCLLNAITIGFNVSHNKMSAQALNDLFTSLGTSAGSQTIIVTGNPGAATCDTSIATGKGFTVTI